MYDKSDPRATLAVADSNTQSGTTAMPASWGRYYQDSAVDDDANGRGWYTRSQNLVVHWIEAKPGATFSRSAQLDEYMIVLPDDDTPYEVTASGESLRGEGIPRPWSDRYRVLISHLHPAVGAAGQSGEFSVIR